MSSYTPLTDEIIKYCEYQFPATQGHIPLRQMIEKIEVEKIELELDYDEIASKIDPVLDKATAIFHENERLRTALEEIATTAHCIALAGPLNTPTLQDAWGKFMKIDSMASNALAQQKAKP
jgi:hypothetical protein